MRLNLPLQATVRPTHGDAIAQLLQLPSVWIWAMCVVREAGNEGRTFNDRINLSWLNSSD